MFLDEPSCTIPWINGLLTGSVQDASFDETTGIASKWSAVSMNMMEKIASSAARRVSLLSDLDEETRKKSTPNTICRGI
jgi:hypothetical protein